MLTSKDIEAHLGKGERTWLSDGGKRRGAGTLYARIDGDVATFYFRYTDSSGRRVPLLLDVFDPKGKRGLTLSKARDAAAGYQTLYRSGIRDITEHLERERAEAEAQRRAAEEAARKAAEIANAGSLSSLLTIYCDDLRKRGRTSEKDARNLFKNHVLGSALADRPAREIEAEEIADLLRPLVAAGKGRTAAKVRSYLHAAYKLAIKSRTDATAPAGLGALLIRHNPVADVGALSEFNRTHDRALSWAELRAYRERVERMEAGAQRDALLACLLLGGQRVSQLLRATADDLDQSAGTITLLDPKGRRLAPRRHVLPLGPKAKALLKRRAEERPDDCIYLFSSLGKVPVRLETLSHAVRALSDELLEAGKATAPFSLADVRRSAETLMAGMGITKDLRGQLQSHGLAGVQDRHYDRYGYAAEKLQILRRWERMLYTKPTKSNVVALRAARR